VIVTAPTVPYRIVPPGFTAEGRAIEGEDGGLDAEPDAASQVVVDDEEEMGDGGLPFFGSGVSEVSNAAEFDDNGPQQKAGWSVCHHAVPPPPPAQRLSGLPWEYHHHTARRRRRRRRMMEMAMPSM
jgi:hypothetical protein